MKILKKPFLLSQRVGTVQQSKNFFFSKLEQEEEFHLKVKEEKEKQLATLKSQF